MAAYFASSNSTAASHAKRAHARVAHDLQASLGGESAEQSIAGVEKSVKVQGAREQQPGCKDEDGNNLRWKYQLQAASQPVQHTTQRQTNHREIPNSTAQFTAP